MKQIKQVDNNQELPKFDKLSEETQSEEKPAHVCLCTDVPYNPNQKNKILAYLGSYDEAPDYMKDNIFIRTGYRINFNTYKKSIQSAFMFSNNEFANIWSHFIGIIISVCLIITVSSFIAQNDVGVIKKTIQELDNIYNNYASQIEVYSNQNQTKINSNLFGINRSEVNERRVSDPRQISKWPVFFYLLSSIGCFSGSVLYHTFNSINKQLHYFLLRLDYAGICFVLLGGSVPIIYYGFYCDSGLLYFYLFLVIFFCSTVFIISLFDFVHSQKYRKLKGALYGSLGLAVSIPLFHLFYRYQFIDEDNDYLSLAPAIPYYILSGSSLLGGLCIYLARCPERFSPGKFDRFGNSHNIWHLCVVSGIVFGYMFGLENYYSRKQTFCYLK